MADLLLELFSEEIPARMQADALAHLERALKTELDKAAMPFEIHGRFVTPRRLAIWLADLPLQQADVNTELKGPKVDAPDAAVQGFLKKSGMKLEQLQKRDGIYVAQVHQKGKATAELLKTIIEDMLAKFPWPKSMRWGNHDITWVRPLHSILCIFDGKVVPVEFGPVKAGNVTYGHRFLAPAAITIQNAGEYETALEKAYVIADREKRKAEILKQAEAAAKKLDLELKNDIRLAEEVTGLVEWPTVLVGTIDAKYMDLPKEVLVSEMRAHQKYFALTKSDGALSDKFLITANMTAKDSGKAIIAGNERVLRARLADGRFFWDQDRKKTLEEMAEGLKSVTYHAKLGSVADKVERVKKLALELARYIPSPLRGEEVERAATLCKADLVSGMVGEFPELQGVMGRYYALHHKESADVADAIRDHYLPLGPDSPVPTKPVSICVALADKLDTLISMFAIGEKPTGSKDPFALRRAALGVIRIVLENNVRLLIAPIIDQHLSLIYSAKLEIFKKNVARQTSAIIQETLLQEKEVHLIQAISPTIMNGQASKNHLTKELISFFHDRLVVQLKDQNIRHDVIKAVVANGDDDLVRIVARAKAVQDFLATDDGVNLLAGYKRAANILAIEEKKDKTRYVYDKKLIRFETGVFIEEEHALLTIIESTQSALAQYLPQENYTFLMQGLATLRNPVDGFFAKVMINHDNETVRENRLRLLAGIRDSMNTVADFSLIEGDAKEQKKAA
jgi:glycyl-tRNA synthetase beta chain